MSSVVVVGTQWGDEGKGKITDFLSENANNILKLFCFTTKNRTFIFKSSKFE